MIYCPASGDTIHPIHVENFLTEQGMNLQSQISSNNVISNKVNSIQDDHLPKNSTVTAEVKFGKSTDEGQISFATTG